MYCGFAGAFFLRGWAPSCVAAATATLETAMKSRRLQPGLFEEPIQSSTRLICWTAHLRSVVRERKSYPVLNSPPRDCHRRDSLRENCDRREGFRARLGAHAP